MRVIVVALVIVTHVVATGPFYNSHAAGAVWMLSHTSRNIFFLISALVLTYVYASRPTMNVRQFYLKRFGFVLPPYIAWTIIYMIQNHDYLLGAAEFRHLLIYNLLTARAMYHLYFLLVIMQLYLVFPLIHRALPFVKRHRIAILTASLLVQLGICVLIVMHSPISPKLGWWPSHPEYFLLANQFYIVWGLIIGLDVPAFGRMLDRFRNWWLPSAALVCALGEVIYALSLRAHMIPSAAAAEFHPFQVIECIFVTLALSSLARRWRVSGAKYQKTVMILSRDSFGIYLSHLYVIYWLMTFQPTSHRWPVVAATAVCGTAVVYVLALGLVEVLRFTPLSRLLTGLPAAPLRHYGRKLMAAVTPS